jgi:hypothetical protein
MSVHVTCGSGPAVAVPVRIWSAIMRLAKKHGVATSRRYEPQEGLRLAQALRRGMARVGRVNRPPYSLFADLEYRYKLATIIALAAEGKGVTVIRA